MVRTKELDQEYLAFSVQFYQFGKLLHIPLGKVRNDGGRSGTIYRLSSLPMQGDIRTEKEVSYT